MSEPILRPHHYLCVSGGKDSLFMFYYCLKHYNEFPFESVVHYELEIDYPWVKDVIDKIEIICSKYNIPFYRIKPRFMWDELYNKYGMPTRTVRWCNSKYKLDCDRQFKEMCKQWNVKPIAYIGFCADEFKRFKYDINKYSDETCDYRYPLAELRVLETEILQWAKNNPIFNNWYKNFDRQGCMFCPMLKRKELAYIYKYYPLTYEKYMRCVKEWEVKYNKSFWGNKYNSSFVDKIIKEKYLDEII